MKSLSLSKKIFYWENMIIRDSSKKMYDKNAKKFVFSIDIGNPVCYNNFVTMITYIFRRTIK